MNTHYLRVTCTQNRTDMVGVQWWIQPSSCLGEKQALPSSSTPKEGLLREKGEFHAPPCCQDDITKIYQDESWATYFFFVYEGSDDLKCHIDDIGKTAETR